VVDIIVLGEDANIIGTTALAMKTCRRKNSEQIQKTKSRFPKMGFVAAELRPH
jgi:hypothetical protein